MPPRPADDPQVKWGLYKLTPLNSLSVTTWTVLWLQPNAPPRTCSLPWTWRDALLPQPRHAGLAARPRDHAAAQSSALTRATPLIYCSAIAVLKFLTRGLAFLFCSGACKLCSWSCLRVKGAARGPWSRGSLEKVQSSFRVSAWVLTTSAHTHP